MPTGYDGEKYTDTDVVALRVALGLKLTQQETQPTKGVAMRKILDFMMSLWITKDDIKKALSESEDSDADKECR